jgi:phosphomannomutase
VADAKSLLSVIEAHYHSSAEHVDHTDGLSMSFAQWRFNVRMSNTEPVVRLNVESRGDQGLMGEKRDELLSMIITG